MGQFEFILFALAITNIRVGIILNRLVSMCKIKTTKEQSFSPIGLTIECSCIFL